MTEHLRRRRGKVPPRIHGHNVFELHKRHGQIQRQIIDSLYDIINIIDLIDKEHGRIHLL